MGNQMQQSFIAFYTSRRFWAIDEISFDQNQVPKEFYNLMAQIVFSHEEDAFRLHVCRDGMILLQIRNIYNNRPSLDVPDWSTVVAWWGTYLEYLNCLYLLLNSSVIETVKVAYFEIIELTHKDIILVKLENGKFISWSEGEIARYHSYDRLAFLCGMQPSLHAHFFNRKVLPNEVFKNLVHKASVVFTQRQLVSQLATITKSLSEYKSGNYSTSLILAWFVIEEIITNRWHNSLQSRNRTFRDGKKRINSDRMSNHTDGRDYPISVILNMLELTGSLPFDTFKWLDSVRSYRNKIVHRDLDFKCTEVHSKEAIELALALSLEGQKVDVKIDYSYSIVEPC